MPSLTLAEARARAADLTVHGYEIDLDLTDAQTAVSRTRIRFGARCAATFAELVGATAVTARLDGVELPAPAYDDGRLHLTGLTGEHELVVEARVPYGTSGDGLLRSVDPADGAVYVMAYTSMDIASHVFACFDQPDLKAPLTLAVTAPAAATVLANGVGTDHGDGRWTFATTPPVSTYLFTMCAGPWHSVRFAHAGLPFAWHARASRAAELDAVAAELRRVTETCFDHYVATFSPPYAFDSYDQVFTPGLNWGAMEFPGCVVYRDELLPRGDATALDRALLASVIAHEMAHMWFGDLVTMRWWEDSWLNESFADYMGYQVSDRAAGYRDAWTDCALTRTPTGYAADRRRSTHPVAEDADRVADVDVAFANFDMITYAKGNAVLRQLAVWLGEETFLAGVDRHLAAHAFGNADLEDLLTALASVSDRDVRGWAAAWLRTTGFDTLRVERADGDVPVLHREGSRPHRLSVAALSPDGALAGTRLVDLAAEPVALPEWAGLAVVPNAGSETFAAVRLDPASRAVVARRLSSVADPLTRGLLWATAADEVATGAAPLAGLLDLAAEHLPPETEPVVFEGALSVVHGALLRYADPVSPGPAGLAAGQATLAATCARVLDAGRDPALTLAATRVLVATTVDVGWLRDQLGSGPGSGSGTGSGSAAGDDLRWRVCRRLAEIAGDLEPALAQAERDRSVAGTLALLRCRAAVPTAAATAEAWERMWSTEVGNRELQALAEGFWAPGRHDLVIPYLARYLAQAPALAARAQGLALVVGSRGFPWLPLPAAALTSFRAALADALDDDLPTVLRRSWSDRLDDLDQVIAARSAG